MSSMEHIFRIYNESNQKKFLELTEKLKDSYKNRINILQNQLKTIENYFIESDAIREKQWLKKESMIKKLQKESKCIENDIIITDINDQKSKTKSKSKSINKKSKIKKIKLILK
eukprot:413350_1